MPLNAHTGQFDRPASLRRASIRATLVILLAFVAVAVGAFQLGRRQGDSDGAREAAPAGPGGTPVRPGAAGTAGEPVEGGGPAPAPRRVGPPAPPPPAGRVYPRDAEGNIDMARLIEQRIASGETPIDPRMQGNSVRFEPAEMVIEPVRSGSFLDTSFDVVNDGVATLRVLAMKPDCKCTTIEDLAGREIGPGDRITVHARIDARQAPASQTNRIQFVFENLGQREYVIRTEVHRALIADPPFLRMDSSPAGDVAIASADGAPFRILRADGADPVFIGFDPATEAPRNTYRLAWDLSAFDPDTCVDPRGRTMPRYWLVETDHPEMRLVVLPVRHVPCTLPDLPSAGRRWFMTPDFIVLDPLAAGVTEEITLRMRWLPNASKTDLIRSATTTSNAIEVELGGMARAGAETDVLLRVRATPGYTGVFTAEVRIDGMSEGQSQRVTILGRVPGPAS
ncbi:MAG: DUF1573 domain-containing protein [Phycisphaeraceae bacterium]|nr:DUF1573 domain-containing protein [Phycisphaeraceae bacterium]